jgi:hypothetical protein
MQIVGTQHTGHDAAPSVRDADGYPTNQLQSTPANEAEPSTWRDEQNLLKFLRAQNAWELYDLMDRRLGATASQTRHAATEANASFDWHNLHSYASRSALPTDQLADAGLLRILLTSDPQKIAEMSTGQRWTSCTSVAGMNHWSVEKDIAAGTLAAYVVHADDTQARWPLMRLLIKPFRN